MSDCGNCWACDPGYQFMFVCSECGNKRCPHANDHRNPCTGSNDSGQVGSAYEHGAGAATARRWSGLSSSLSEAFRRSGDEDSAEEVEAILKNKTRRPTLAQRLLPRC